mmetsp:Transcript_16934/g.43233  ORF Transcript_16934/g.43233 Transcript_16934/m.43233 type:complete len:255 (+) Transcript_16934:74-838(+)|eukprot:CAMPEP_0177650334 /NCGR_PEP_ID=MMETSP0447-20121125/11885_1 /TAXON_ID=0 /ORGANISM="Stygamoeba regulata, Strain BSH-02190019" /LENGTH=254 /DNA_ID=CAMNT_0019153193 /DNA_START=44 /DNA_END=808 /DNA_ORIENTATION=+
MLRLLHKLGQSALGPAQCHEGLKALVPSRSVSLAQTPLTWNLKQGILPWISGRNLMNHYDNYHKGLVRHANHLVSGYPEFTGATFDNVIRVTGRSAESAQIYNCFGAHWNHCFLWDIVQPNPEKSQEGFFYPSARILRHFDIQFGGFERFKKQFKAHALSLHSNGWVWLVVRQGHLEIMVMADSDCPYLLQPSITPILCLDMWEHAYVIDYFNDKGAYVDNFWYVVDWRKVEAHLPRECSFVVDLEEEETSQPL